MRVSRGDSHYVAYQDKIMVGLLEHKTTTVIRGGGTEKITQQVRITPKGLARIAEIFETELVTEEIKRAGRVLKHPTGSKPN